jgi:peroxiredoxin
MDAPALYTQIPNFELPDLQNRTVSLWSYKQQQPLVLVLCGEENLALLDDFAHRYHDYHLAGAEVLAIARRRPPSGHFPFRVLVDTEGQVIPYLVNRTPAALVLDSYGELHTRLEGPWPEGLDHERILGPVTLIQTQCPECGVPWAPWV